MKVTCKVYLQSLVREEVWKAYLASSTTTWKKCPLSKIRAPSKLSSTKFTTINTSTNFSNHCWNSKHSEKTCSNSYQPLEWTDDLDLVVLLSWPSLLTTPTFAYPTRLRSKTVISFLLHLDVIYYVYFRPSLLLLQPLLHTSQGLTLKQSFLFFCILTLSIKCTLSFLISKVRLPYSYILEAPYT